MGTSKIRFQFVMLSLDDHAGRISKRMCMYSRFLILRERPLITFVTVQTRL